MSAVNDTQPHPSVFLLTGIPGLEDVYVWISIPFCLLYVTSILGNSVILFIIKTDPNFHGPMYIFISMLAITDLGFSISTMPTTLGMFCFNSLEISHNACFAQVFFIHLLVYTESSVLVSMAFDRVVAICNPLRYASILTPPRIAKMGLVSLLRGVALTFPYPFLLKQYQYCQDNTLSHSFCIHEEVMKKAYSDIRPSIIYGLFVTISSVVLDFLLILLSYAMILKTVLRGATHTDCFKALNTRVAHICVILLFYLPGISLSIIYRFGKSSSTWIQNVLSDFSFLILPLMNPVVYSVNNKAIRERLIRVFIK